MAIVKMKRLHMLALESDRDELFDKLQRLGCLEVAEQSERLSDPEWASLVHRDESLLSGFQDRQAEVAEALSILDKHAPAKSGLLSTRPTAKEAQLFDDAAGEKSTQTVREISAHSDKLSSITDQIQRVNSTMKSLVPWLSLDVPLDIQPQGVLYTAFGTVPATVSLDAVREALAAEAEAAELYEVSSDTDVHYLFFLCHKARKEDALEVLKSFSFSNVTFKDISGTAQENFDKLSLELSGLEQQQEQLLETLQGLGEERLELQLHHDRLTQEIQKESYKERLLTIDKTFFLEGWVPAKDAPQLEKQLTDFVCAYEITDPTEEEYPNVPIKLKNGPIARCMNTVTEMYSLPTYDGIDPNPFMFPFFVLFFGIMMADMGYGILMIVGCLFILKKTRPRENMRNFFELFFWCGVATFIIGAMTGGFFGDFLPQLAKLINPESTFNLPALFTPLDDTIAIMVGSLALGLIQVITGMAISVWKKCKDGCWQDALWDEVCWWVIILGIGLAVLGVGNIAGYPAVLIIGCLMLVYGGTRNAKGFGKVTALIGAVYNGISGFFSDILSYLRLMALMLSGSVIASVFNTLGAAFGNIPFFIVIAIIGNALNLALNLLGCYVHDLRLQCLEYFNRFYSEGGKAYQPLSINTKYIDIIKEEN